MIVNCLWQLCNKHNHPSYNYGRAVTIRDLNQFVSIRINSIRFKLP